MYYAITLINPTKIRTKEILLYSTRTHDHAIVPQRKPEIAIQVSVHAEECNREQKARSKEEGERGCRVSAHAIKHTAFTAEQLCVPVLGRLGSPGKSFGFAYFCRQTTKTFCANLTR